MSGDDLNLSETGEHLFRVETKKNLLAAISRREFIKLLGGAGLGIAFALIGLDKLSLTGRGLSTVYSQNQGLLMRAFGQSVSGSWTPVSGTFNTDIVAIHTALYYKPQALMQAKILTIAGSGFNRTYPPPHGVQPPPGTLYKASVYDPSNGNKAPLPDTNPNDLFCCHQAQLPNGDILIAGGTSLYEASVDPDNCNHIWRGLKTAYRFNSTTEQLQAVPSMREGRWYPTLVCLSDGRVAAFAGYDEKGTNNLLIEIFDPSDNSWKKAPWGTGSETTYTPGDFSNPDYECEAFGTPYSGGNNPGQYGMVPINDDLGLYPRMHLMPSGLILVTGMANPKRAWNPTAVAIGGVPSGGWRNCVPANTFSTRYYGNSFLLPLENTLQEKGRILLTGGGAGGSSTAPVTGITELLEFTSPTTYDLLDGGDGIQSLNHPRKFALQVILPDGKCVVFGGTKNSQGALSDMIYIPEMFDPENKTAGWTDLAPASVARTYHSTALLLPDGTVWTASGTPTSTPGSPQNLPVEKTVEFYKPWYISETVTRPTITSVASVGDYGGEITINTPDGFQIDTIHGVSLVKLEASTHHFEPNQRLIWLPFVRSTASSYTCQAPLNSVLAPKGYYMIHIIKNGVPSQAKIIQIPGTAIPDNTTPGLQISSPAAAEVVSGPVSGFSISVVGSATDNTPNGIAGVQVIGPDGQTRAASNSSGDWSTWTATVDTGSGVPGTVQRTIKATATDTSGNQSSLIIPIMVNFV